LTLTRTLTGFVTPADKAADDYLLLPFEVPTGTGRLVVRYTFTNAASAAAPPGSGNVIDTGIFDPRGAALPHGAGFRGWSGSGRRVFTLSPNDATPGYLPGPIQPGTWHVILGLYRIIPAGCHYQVTVELYGDQPAVPNQEISNQELSLIPRSLSPGWYRGDLQSHTYHSDATGSPKDLASAARARGLDFVAVTDHNTTSHWPYLAAAGGDNLLLIPGEEITTYYGHANVWGASSWIDFRCRNTARMAQIIEAAHAAGGLVSANHPKPGGPSWEYGFDLPLDAIEVWQGLWSQGNHVSLGLWDRLLHQGRRIVAVGGSDKHQGPFTGQFGPYELGNPTTWVWARELSVAGILTGIRAGHVFITWDVSGPRIKFTCQAGEDTAMMGDEPRVTPGSNLTFRCGVDDAAGCWLHIVQHDHATIIPIDGDVWEHTWSIVIKDGGFVRLEVVEPMRACLAAAPESYWVHALTNPVYIRVLT
jgi:hypothetical protein